MDQEIWKSFPGLQRRYQISNFGRHRSKNRIAKSDGHLIKGRILVAHLKKDCGYIVVKLRKNGVLREYKIHRMVGIAFIPNPEGKPQINHLDGDKTNNHHSNLEWATGKENTNHAQRIGLIPSKDPAKVRIPKNRFQIRRKRVVNTLTGELYDSPAELSKKIGYTAKYIRKRLGGELPNNTIYKYEGSYSAEVVNRPFDKRKSLNKIKKN